MTEPLKCSLSKNFQCDDREVCKKGGSVVDECLCGDDSDEMHFLDDKCFRCLSHHYKVMPISMVCDSNFDCKDLSDECLCLNPTSRPQLCDLADFGDKKDISELVTPRFSCDAANTSKMIDEEEICDQRDDCKDKVDEKNCGDLIDQQAVEKVERIYTCPKSLYGPKTATPCDGKPECYFARKEECNCNENPKFCKHFEESVYFGGKFFSSDQGILWRGYQVCDGFAHAKDKTDELYCTNRTHLYCEDESKPFLPANKKCDQVLDCNDGSDEWNCSENFNCLDEGSDETETKYIHIDKVCDGNPDCYYGRDECLHRCVKNVFSSLIRNKGVLGVVVFISLLALSGNLIVFVRNVWLLVRKEKKGRTRAQEHGRKKSKINRILILNLTMSDTLVAIYTMVICVQSMLTEGNYCLKDQDWRSGIACSAIGVLLVIGSEESIFNMILIIAFRLFTILKPVASIPFKKILLAIGITWILSILLAVIPLISALEDIFITSIWYANNALFSTIQQNDVTNLTQWLLLMHKNTNETHGNIGSWSTLEKLIGDLNPNLTASRRFGFYSSHAICIPILFPEPMKNASWWYSLVLLILNFIGFVAIAVGYAWMYKKATKKNMARTEEMQDALTSEMQQRVAIIIGTDFFCWIPVCIMGFLQMAGVNISVDWRFAVGLIILPINCALNPMIYSGLHLPVWRLMKRAGSFLYQNCNVPECNNGNENPENPADIALAQLGDAAEHGDRNSVAIEADMDNNSNENPENPADIALDQLGDAAEQGDRNSVALETDMGDVVECETPV